MTRDAATTPVIPGFFPDPSVCRVGEDYFLVNSSFEYAPGIPIHHSRDLRTWTQLGNVLTRETHSRPGDRQRAAGSTRPRSATATARSSSSARMVERGGEQFVVTATDPAGPWSDPIVFAGLGGIDPDPRVGRRRHLLPHVLRARRGAAARRRVSAGDRAGPRGPRSRRPARRAAGDLARERARSPEGPHLYRRGEWWYLLTAEAAPNADTRCASRGRGRSTVRSRLPQRIRSSAAAARASVQNTGHADLVQRPDGSWAMVYLGVRPHGFTPGFHVVGRETFLARDRLGRRLARGAHRRCAAGPSRHGVRRRLRDRRPAPAVGLARRTAARPHPAGGVAVEHHELAVRVRDLRWRFEARVDASAAIALRVRLDERHWYEIALEAGAAVVRARIGPLAASVGFRFRDRDVVTLLVEAVDATHDGPDDLRFGVLDADGERWIAALDGRYLSTEVAGGFHRPHPGAAGARPDAGARRERPLRRARRRVTPPPLVGIPRRNAASVVHLMRCGA